MTTQTDLTPEQTLEEWDRARLMPDETAVDALRELLDLTANFPDNDQRARYLLTCNWMRDRTAERRSSPWSTASARTPPSTRAVTIAQAAPILGLSRWETYLLIESGALPAVKFEDGPYLIAVRDLLEAATA